MASPPLNKQTEMLRLLDEGQVMVHLDPRRDGVQVPGHLASDAVLRLNIAYGFNLPSLEVDDEGVYAVLSFGGRDFGCWLPWESIFAVTLPGKDHQGALWPQDMPAELDPLFASVRHLETTEDGVTLPEEAKSPGLSVINGGAQPHGRARDEVTEPDSEDPGQEPPSTGGSHLRLVKG